jgi:hypothetical protein
MEVLKNFGLVFCRDLIPLPNMIKIASPIGFQAFLIMKTKERIIFVCEVAGKRFSD